MKKLLKHLLISVIVSVMAFSASYFQVLSTLDLTLTDNLYSQLRPTSKDIIIVSIDEDTLNEYGAFSVWSREKTADLINYLYSDKNNLPIVVGVDILFQGDTDEEKDQKLADACVGRNVVVSSSIKFKGTVNAENMSYDRYNISYIEHPYDSLYKSAETAFTNSIQSEDGVNRCSAYYFDFNNEKNYSLSYTLATKYAEAKNIQIKPIRQDSNGLFRFYYAGEARKFTHVSLREVLSGSFPNSEFKDKIVLLGAYASSMQDEYYATSDIGTTMYGIEIHANIIQSILDGKTSTNYNNLYYSLILAGAVFAICLLSLSVDNFIISILIPIAALFGHAFLGKYLSNNGTLISQIYGLISFGLITIVYIIRRSISELYKRRQVTKVFSRYMDPKLVSKAVKDDQDKINLNGEKREVSVLFVDIRGFTTLSESMSPEDIVTILNEYLTHVTNCIFKHNGLLDKFIGDAAMAIFNAPIDQKDYIYESVATAYDIVKGAEALKKMIYDKFNKEVSFGVGVHCGEAVIGNIGCKTRMDYTAIGDTVNTASRIEGKAGRGEVLISADVKEKLETRITVEDAGYIELKGKAEPVHVYRLLDINGGDSNEK